MSILIKGMEMPNHCGECGIEWCERWKRLIVAGMPSAKARPEDCPIVPVQPHGRLIDADAEVARVQNLYNKAVAKDPEMGCVNVYEGEIAVLKLAPTIIPAEEGET